MAGGDYLSVLMKIKPFLLRSAAGLLVAAVLSVSASAAAPQHDMYAVGAINNSGRVIGAKDQAANGVFLRGDDGTFSHIGLNYPALISVSFDPRDPRLFYAASLSGVLRTPDGGKSWRVATGWDETEPKSVAVDPNEPDTVYAGLPDGFTVSHDQGFTWKRMENGLPARGKYTQVIAVDRLRAGRVFAGCEKGIYLTEDGAKSWRQVFASSATVNDVRQSPVDPRLWMAVTQSDGALISRDGGLTWTRLSGTPSEKALYNVAFDATNANRLAIASWTYGLLTSEDGGQTWTPRNEGLPTPHRVWRTAIDPDTGRLYAAVVEQALYMSDDFGRTWQVAGMEGSLIQSFSFVPKAAK